jgi:hypothetical protein
VNTMDRARSLKRVVIPRVPKVANRAALLPLWHVADARPTFPCIRALRR